MKKEKLLAGSSIYVGWEMFCFLTIAQIRATVIPKTFEYSISVGNCCKSRNVTEKSSP